MNHHRRAAIPSLRPEGRAIGRVTFRSHGAAGTRAWGRVHGALVLLVWASALAGVAPGWGEEEAGPQPLLFRRYLVPKSQIQELARGCEPMRREEFERMLAEARAASARAASDLPARITRATYSARLEEDQLVEGQASLDLARTSKVTSVLQLSPCGLALGKPFWADDESATPNMGMDSRGNTVVVVDRDVPLRLPWSLRGTRDDLGEIVFSLQFPTCPMNELILDLPAGKVPAVEGGFVEAIEEKPPEARGTGTAGQGPEGSSAAGRRKWRVEFAGGERIQLRIVPQERPRGQRQLVLACQATTYLLAESGLEVQTRLALDVCHEPLDRLELRADRSLAVAWVRLGEKETAFSTVDPSESAQKVVIEFAEPLRGAGHEVVVCAFAPWVPDRAWRLPVVQPLGVVWQRGEATLEVPGGLVVKKLGTEACVETAFEPLPPPSGGERRQFQLLQPGASPEIVVGRQRPQSDLLAGTTVRMSETQMAGRCVMQVAPLHGTLFALEARGLEGWIIDRVETVPPEMMSATPPMRQGAQLRVELKRGVRAGEEVRLVVTAHRRPPAAGAPLGGRAMRILELGDLHASRHLVSIRAEPSFRLSMSGDAEVPRLDPERLSAQERGLIDASADAWIYVDGPAANGLSVGLRREEPRFSARVAVEAVVAAKTVQQAYSLRCEPLGSRVARLRVRFSRPCDGELRWQLVGEIGPGLSARRQAPAGPEAGGEVWEVSLLRPRSEPFEIQVQHTARLASETPLALVSLPGASSQVATILVGTRDGSPLKIRAENVTAIPAPAVPDGQYPVARAMYRYDPSRDAVVAVSRAEGAGTQRPAWVWHAELMTRIETTGTARHEAVFRLENSGLPQVVAVLPDQARPVACSVDGKQVSWPAGGGLPQRLPLRLPAGVRFPTLHLSYETAAPPLRWFAAVPPTWPSLELPCLERTWSVWLPPGYEAVSDDRLLSPSPAGRVGWDERLFGLPLVRRNRSPFNPFSTADWRKLRSDLDRGAAERTAGEFVAAWEQVRERLARQPGRDPTWEEMLVAYDRWRQGEPRRRPAILVDEAALEGLAITPDSPATAVGTWELTRGPGGPRGGAEVAAVAGAGEILLTSRESQWRCGSILSWTDRHPVAIVHSSRPLRDALSPLCHTAQWKTPSEWIGSRPVFSSPWAGLREAELSDAPLAGWTNCRLHSPPEETRPLLVYRPRHVQAVGLATLFMLAGLGLAAWRWRPSLQLPAVAAGAALAILSPVEFLPVARGVFLGLLLSVALRTVQRPRQKNRLPRAAAGEGGGAQGEMRGTRAVATLAVTALLLGAPADEWVRGEEAGSAASGERDVIPLLVPVDEKGQPSGDYVYVPRALYQAMHSPAVFSRVLPRAWMIQSASYEVTLRSLQQPEEGTSAAEVVADYELEVSKGVREVRLPLAREGARLREATLEGRTIYPLWDADGRALAFDVGTAGRLRLTLSFRPLIQDHGPISGFEIGIPAFPRSRLRVKTDGNVEDLLLPTAAGAVSRRAAAGEVSADLGPVDKLSVHWKNPELAEAPASGIAASELFLVKVQPSSVMVDARFTFHVREGVLRQVALLADPRWRLLPMPPGEPVVRHEIQEGAIQTIRLELDQAYRDEVTVQASFLLEETRGLGDLRLPRLQTAAARASTPWVGVWLAPGLELTVLSSLQARPQDVAEFLSHWGATEATPCHAVRAPLEESSRLLAIRAASPRKAAEQEMQISLGAETARVSFRAWLRIQDSDCVQQRISVPRGLRIRDVQAHREGLSCLSRWADDNAGTATVFFSGPISGDCVLLLEAEMPAPRTLPVISLQDAEVQKHVVRVYRRSDVQLEVTDLAGWEPVPGAGTGQYVPAKGRLVATLQAADPKGLSAARAALQLAPNRPSVRGQLLTQLSLREQQWCADARLNLQVSGGVVDALRLEVPREFGQPYQLNPPLPFELQDVPGQERRILLIWPAEPAQGEVSLHVSGTLQPAADQRVRAPEIRVLDVEEVRCFLVVPTRSARQQIAWETSGLQAVAPPPDVKPLEGDAESSATFEVIGPRPQAVLTDVDRSTSAPQVQLAEVSVAWTAPARCYGVASFDLEPARLTHLDLELPPSLRLVQARVANLPATAEPVGDRWRLPLGPDQLPQRIELIFTGKLPPRRADLGGQVFPGPAIPGLPVAHTSWTVRGPLIAGPGRPALAHTAVDATRQIQLRIRSAEQVLDAAQEILAHSSSPELEACRDEWQRRIQAARGDLARNQGRNPGLAARRASEAGSAERASVPLRQETRPATDAAAIWDLLQRSGGPATRCAVQGVCPHIVVDYSEAGVRFRPLVAALFLLALMAVLLAQRSTLLSEWLVRWPYVAGSLLGLAWWLWLTPSLLGLAILLACLAGSLRLQGHAA